MTMQAVRFHGQRDIRLEHVPIPTCGKGQVKVRPAYVGICGTDLHEYLGGPSLIPTTPHPITGEQAPVTLGHEISGVIEEVGEDVTDIKVGAKVAIVPILYDGTCGACKEGFVNCCEQMGAVGLTGWGGGLSEHVVVPRKAAIEIPENMSLEVAGKRALLRQFQGVTDQVPALVEPLAVAWHAVNVSSFKKGDSVLILGGGPIGLATIQALKARGADKIILSEISPKRKEFAKEFGAHYVLDPTKEDIVARARELCDGEGVNIAFDAAGVQAGLDAAVQAIRVRGLLVNIAIWEKTATIIPNLFSFRERGYRGVVTYQEGDFRDVLNAIEAGRIQPKSMITRKIKMDEVEENGFRALIDDKDNQVKILVEVSP